MTSRVMKCWTKDCKPTKWGDYWVCAEGRFIAKRRLSEDNIDAGTIDGMEITHWLEVEGCPTLPEEVDCE